MSPRIWSWLGIGVITLAALLGILLLDRLESYEEVRELGASPEARRNPYLAAELFLAGQQRKVRQASGLEVLDELPTRGQTLLMLGDRTRMTPGQARKVLNWAERGGHLLFVAEEIWDEAEGKSGDLLLDQLGIRQYLTEDLEKIESRERLTQRLRRGRKDVTRAPEAPGEESAPTDNLTRLYLENEDEPAYIGFDPDYHLHDAENRAHAWANSRQATHLLLLSHGKGFITVLTDPRIWQNEKISQHDNAWLLWYLTQDSEVTLLHRSERDALGVLLLRHFPLALTAGLLLLTLLLWRRGMRHGPLLPAAGTARRQLEEHLRGSADFLLRRTGQRQLIQILQQDIQRRARRRHPGFERLPVAEQWQVLGRLTRQRPGEIRQAMRPLSQERLSAAQFTRQVAHLQNLRNAL